MESRVGMLEEIIRIRQGTLEEMKKTHDLLGKAIPEMEESIEKDRGQLAGLRGRKDG